MKSVKLAKNGASKPVTLSKDQQCFASKKNVYEHAAVFFKIVAECKEDVFLEGVPV